MKKTVFALAVMAYAGIATACSTEWERFSIHMHAARVQSTTHQMAFRYWKDFQRTDSFKTQCVSNPSFLIGTYRNYLMKIGESLSRPKGRPMVRLYSSYPDLASVDLADALVQSFTQAEADRYDKTLMR